METTHASENGRYIGMAFLILAACLVLFSLDKEMHTPFDLINSGNLLAMLVYFLPTYLITLFFYGTLKGKKSAFVLSMVMGVFSGFSLVFSSLYLMLH